MPAPLTCCASTVAIATVPVAMPEVTSGTERFSWPALRSRDRAWGRSCSRCRLASKSGSNGEDTSLAGVP
jgi:hypothetical protein